MKTIAQLILSITLILVFTGCSSVKVLSSWEADDVGSIKDNNFIVIARTDNNSARIAFENEIVKQLSEKGMKATASFTRFPKLNPDQKISDEKRREIISILENEGYNAVVLTVVKDVENLTKTTQDGGYYAGGSYGYYPSYYGGFRNYYYNPMSYSTIGNYVPGTTTTTTSKNYVLEPVIYNLEEPENKQLVAVVTSKLEDPENASSTAKEYVNAVMKSLDKK